MPVLKKIVNKKLGEILEDAGYLKPDDIAAALNIQKSTGDRFGEILVKEGYCSEENIIRALVNQLNAPFLDIQGYNLKEELVTKIPYEMAMMGGLLPLDQIGEIVLVAITAPISMEMFTSIEENLGGSLHLCIADMNQVKNKIESIYPDDMKPKTKKRTSNTMAMSVSAQEHAVQQGGGAKVETAPENQEAEVTEEKPQEGDDGMTGLGNLLLGD